MENHNSVIQSSPSPRSPALPLVAAANAASFLLIELAVFVNAETSEFIQSGVTVGGKPVGDWKITVEKLGAEKSKAEQLEMFDVPATGAALGPGHGES